MITRCRFGITAVLLALLLVLPSISRAVAVHTFDCKQCHIPSLSVSQLGGGNVCLQCHDETIGPTNSLLSDGAEALVNSAFSPSDASHALGNNPTYYNASGLGQTSHNWGAPDTQPRAGAVAPAPAQFYSRYGSSTGKVTCSRCHNPHATRENPQLLVLGAGSTEAMCVACHVPFNKSASTDTTGNNTTHPVGINYPTEAEGYVASPPVDDGNLHIAGSVSLVGGKIMCGSCHQVHFADSNAVTADTPGNFAQLSSSGGDGKLLRGDGVGRADKSSLCRTCHTYQAHGGGSAETVGCLVCHSGHAYDPVAPNYFMLRKTATTARYNTVSGLDYSNADVLDPLQKSTWWNDGLDSMAAGYCEKCHGDAAALPGSIHASSSVCTDCHKHSADDGGSFGHPGDGDCAACHSADHVVDSSQMNWVTIFDNTAGHSYELGSPPFTVDAYATCSMCHTTNLLTQHDSNCIICHFGAAPPRDSFTVWDQTCQQGSCHPSYHANASNAHDTEWDNDNCTKCHNESGFDIPWTWDSNLDGYVATYSACGKCHTLKPDTTPPASHTNLQPDYVDTASITLWANDATAVQAIYYRIDGGSTQTYGSPFEVAPPADGSQAHTLEYWAKDTPGNIETANVRNFTVTKDTTPPVTTSDAKPLYGTDATIRLTASDDATSFPVAATYYKVGAGGTVQSGNTAVIPEPASGSAEHTLYFWSVDHAGNVEDPPKSATFTIVANGLVQTDMPMGGWLYGYSDPYLDADRVLADPWMSYAIYVDDVLIDTITRKFYVSILSNGQLWPSMPQTWTTTWRCPPGIPVSSGSHIDIVVDAGFSDRVLRADANDLPATYTITLPAGTAQLESIDWAFTTSLNWASSDYDDDLEEEISRIDVLPAVANIAYVTTVPDTTPPVTTSNAVSGKAYIGATAFALSASDPGGTGIESTWWQLDSTGGTWTQGTSITIPSPVSGTKAHTLYWYSKDNAGNQEPVKSVSFSIETISTATTSLPLNAWVYYDTSPGALGPGVNYTIYLDGALISNFNANAASPVSATNQTFGRAIPQVDITGAGKIDIVVNAGFTTYDEAYGTNAPYTFTMTLPVGAKRLEAAVWTGFPRYTWDQWAYEEAGDYEYSTVAMPPGTIGNITYASTGTDIVAPATTISAIGGATYSGDQIFILSATDADSGVESTWWQLDGSGVWNIGTSIPVTAPVSGTVSHTITWYSRDNAANQEAVQSVTFNLQP